MGNLGSDCILDEILTEKQECMVAATQLRIEYKGKYNSNDRPKGCYYWPIDNTVYFNEQNQSIERNIDWRTGGLCKRSMSYNISYHTHRFKI